MLNSANYQKMAILELTLCIGPAEDHLSGLMGRGYEAILKVVFVFLITEFKNYFKM